MPKAKSRTGASELLSDVSVQSSNNAIRTRTFKPADYSSEGVKDHDVFLLPGSDYQIMAVVTLIAAIVRVFRIYQPSSVVFDEVQYVSLFRFDSSTMLTTLSIALAALHRSTSRANSSWMFILRLRNSSSRLLVG
jgi:hypothetical protein